MTPYLVTPPASLPVDLNDLKAHLREDASDEDFLIESLQQGAVAMLDGWGGALGRCIMPQVWAIDVKGPGPHGLPFPDASDIAASAGDDDLEVVVVRAFGVPIEVCVLGPPAGETITITARYALPDERVPAAQVLIKLIVGNWFANRESVVIGTISSELPMAANALISALRWFRV